ncbi:MAG: UDP-N-acetylmuramoyl-tripeptide--D-alanyl-D-alanine ligase [Candidatus Pacebacteria bacterium]|jgi:UDP-N-acetylmuramoyl-tripeptide--D-alanyl-D-alanine ligase|nr:UDP-N-acetylmuramoyl-tripeptide--D-alanyl-D-alanine ligase [Candidatus Paceibacterota bacterium]
MLKNIIKNIITVILEAEARLVLKKYKPKVIAVTGNVGKTSTKDAIFTVVGETLVARKSVKSFNSEIGLPLTILNCENGWSNPFLWLKNIIKGFLLVATRMHYPKWLVLEIGASKPGDISRATSLITPDIAVVTRFSEVPVHVEFFKSPDELFEEKANLVKALRNTGVLIVNADDERVLALREKTKAKSLTYGLNSGAMFCATNIQTAYESGVPVGTTFKLEYDGNVFPVALRGVLGVQPVYSALAAIATGAYLKLNIIDILGRLAAHQGPSGRMRLIPALRGATLIDDTYNASPVAAEAAVEALRGIKTKGRRIVVLGDMLELGKYTIDEHKKLGSQAGSFADIIIAVGPRARYIVEGALGNDMDERNILEFDNSKEAGKTLEGLLKEGDIVLVKGSQGMRMERIVEEVMAEPQRASELLVRQEEEWKARG